MVVKLEFHNSPILLKNVVGLEIVKHDEKDWYLLHLKDNGTAYYPRKYTEIIGIKD